MFLSLTWVETYGQPRHALPGELKHRLLTKPYRPAAGYNFSGDRPGKKFRYAWLEQFSPWLSIHKI